MTDYLPTWVSSVMGIEGLGFVDSHSLCSLESPLSSKEALVSPSLRDWTAAPWPPIGRLRSALMAYRNALWWGKPREKYWKDSPYTSFDGEIRLWKGPTFYCSRCSLVTWHRCRECEREKARWLRARKLAEDLTAVSRHLKKSIRFITLTIPNQSDPAAGVILMKSMVKKLRRRVGFKEHVVGGSDFYEYTRTKNGYNVHHHGLWIGDYYKQEELTKDWGEGHVWITAIRRGKKGTKRMVNYAVKYTTKQAELGIRARQRFGCLYGPAFAELNLALSAAEQ